MKRIAAAAIAAIFATGISTPALAQEEAAPPSQDAAWHNRQSLALASRQAGDGWGWLPGGVLWRRIAGDGTGAHPTVEDTVTLH